MREKVFRFLAKLSVFLTIWTAVLGAGSSAHAAGMLYMRDVMARLQTSTSGEHTITFQLPAAIAVGGQIDLRFTTSTAGQSNFTFAAGASTTRDIDITTSTATGTGMNVSVDTCTGTYAERNPVTTTATTADGNFWGLHRLFNRVDLLSHSINRLLLPSPSILVFGFALGITHLIRVMLICLQIPLQRPIRARSCT